MKKLLNFKKDIDTEKTTTEIKEEENMNKVGFVKKHWKGLLVGGLAAVGTAAALIIRAGKKSDDDNYVEFSDEEAVESEEVASEE